MDLESMKRKDLQALCKKHGVPANIATLEMIAKLSLIFKEQEKPGKRVPSCLKNLSDVAVDSDTKAEAENPKKVQFSQESEMFEFVESGPGLDRLKRAERRAKATRSAATNTGLSSEKNSVNDESSEAIVDNLVGLKRGRGRKSTVEDVITDKSPPVTNKRARGRAHIENIEEVAESEKQVSGDAGGEETKGQVKRSTRGRKVDASEDVGAEDVAILAVNVKPSSSRTRRNAKGGDASEDAGEVVRPPERNGKKAKEPELLNVDTEEVKLPGKVRESRKVAMEKSSVIETGSVPANEVELVPQLGEPSRRFTRNRGIEVETSEITEVVRPQKRKGKKADEPELLKEKPEVILPGRATRLRKQATSEKSDAMEMDIGIVSEVEVCDEPVIQVEETSKHATRNGTEVGTLETTEVARPAKRRGKKANEPVLPTGISEEVKLPGRATRSRNQVVSEKSSAIETESGIASEVGVHEDSVLQHEEPSRRTTRNDLKGKTDLSQKEGSKIDASVVERKTRKRPRDPVSEAAQEVELEAHIVEENEKDRKSRRNTVMPKSIAPRKEKGGKAEVVGKIEPLLKMVEESVESDKNNARKRRRVTVEEETSLIGSPVVKEPQKRFTRHASRSEVEDAVVNETVAETKKPQSNSRKPRKEAVFNELTSASEEPPVVGTGLPEPELDSFAPSVDKPHKQSTRSTPRSKPIEDAGVIENVERKTPQTKSRKQKSEVEAASTKKSPASEEPNGIDAALTENEIAGGTLDEKPQKRSTRSASKSELNEPASVNAEVARNRTPQSKSRKPKLEAESNKRTSPYEETATDAALPEPELDGSVAPVEISQKRATRSADRGEPTGHASVNAEVAEIKTPLIKKRKPKSEVEGSSNKKTLASEEPVVDASLPEPALTSDITHVQESQKRSTRRASRAEPIEHAHVEVAEKETLGSKVRKPESDVEAVSIDKASVSEKSQKRSTRGSSNSEVIENADVEVSAKKTPRSRLRKPKLEIADVSSKKTLASDVQLVADDALPEQKLAGSATPLEVSQKRSTQSASKSEVIEQAHGEVSGKKTPRSKLGKSESVVEAVSSEKISASEEPPLVEDVLPEQKHAGYATPVVEPQKRSMRSSSKSEHAHVEVSGKKTPKSKLRSAKLEVEAESIVKTSVSEEPPVDVALYEPKHAGRVSPVEASTRQSRRSASNKRILNSEEPTIDAALSGLKLAGSPSPVEESQKRSTRSVSRSDSGKEAHIKFSEEKTPLSKSRNTKSEVEDEELPVVGEVFYEQENEAIVSHVDEPPKRSTRSASKTAHVEVANLQTPRSILRKPKSAVKAVSSKKISVSEELPLLDAALHEPELAADASLVEEPQKGVIKHARVKFAEDQTPVSKSRKQKSEARKKTSASEEPFVVDAAFPEQELATSVTPSKESQKRATRSSSRSEFIEHAHVEVAEKNTPRSSLRKGKSGVEAQLDVKAFASEEPFVVDEALSVREDAGSSTPVVQSQKRSTRSASSTELTESAHVEGATKKTPQSRSRKQKSEIEAVPHEKVLASDELSAIDKALVEQEPLGFLSPVKETPRRSVRSSRSELIENALASDEPSAIDEASVEQEPLGFLSPVKETPRRSARSSRSELIENASAEVAERKTPRSKWKKQKSDVEASSKKISASEELPIIDEALPESVLEALSNENISASEELPVIDEALPESVPEALSSEGISASEELPVVDEALPESGLVGSSRKATSSKKSNRKTRAKERHSFAEVSPVISELQDRDQQVADLEINAVAESPQNFLGEVEVCAGEANTSGKGDDASPSNQEDSLGKDFNVDSVIETESKEDPFLTHEHTSPISGGGDEITNFGHEFNDAEVEVTNQLEPQGITESDVNEKDITGHVGEESPKTGVPEATEEAEVELGDGLEARKMSDGIEEDSSKMGFLEATEEAEVELEAQKMSDGIETILDTSICEEDEVAKEDRSIETSDPMPEATNPVELLHEVVEEKSDLPAAETAFDGEDTKGEVDDHIEGKVDHPASDEFISAEDETTEEDENVQIAEEKSNAVDAETGTSPQRTAVEHDMVHDDLLDDHFEKREVAEFNREIPIEDIVGSEEASVPVEPPQASLDPLPAASDINEYWDAVEISDGGKSGDVNNLEVGVPSEADGLDGVSMEGNVSLADDGSETEESDDLALSQLNPKEVDPVSSQRFADSAISSREVEELYPSRVADSLLDVSSSHGEKSEFDAYNKDASDDTEEKKETRDTDGNSHSVVDKFFEMENEETEAIGTHISNESFDDAKGRDEAAFDAGPSFAPEEDPTYNETKTPHFNADTQMFHSQDVNIFFSDEDDEEQPKEDVLDRNFLYAIGEGSENVFIQSTEELNGAETQEITDLIDDEIELTDTRVSPYINNKPNDPIVLEARNSPNDPTVLEARNSLNDPIVLEGRSSPNDPTVLEAQSSPNEQDGANVIDDVIEFVGGSCVSEYMENWTEVMDPNFSEQSGGDDRALNEQDQSRVIEYETEHIVVNEDEGRVIEYETETIEYGTENIDDSFFSEYNENFTEGIEGKEVQDGGDNSGAKSETQTTRFGDDGK